jgi:signal transduction histidine kinase
MLDPHTYGRIGYLLAAGVLGTVEFVFLVTAISVGVGLAITLIGIPILLGTVYAWGGFAEAERRVIGLLTGVSIPSPYRHAPENASWWVRLRTRLADPATWKDLAFLLLQFPFGLAALIVTTVVLSFGIHGVFLPFWYWAVPDGMDYGLFRVDHLWEALLIAPLGTLVLVLGIPALSALGRLYTSYAQVLLGSNDDPAVTAQMTDLRDARSRIIEAADAERRRIERDLHDGAQQRLVALALTLRMAEKRSEGGHADAAELVRQAGDEAALALKDLRDLARGIHPAILTNRGLPAALDDLAGRASVPARVIAAPKERLPEPVEATAYFVVSECLVNVDKHAQAESATVSVVPRDGQLVVTVSDDGVGGAALDGGSGLQGLEDRVGALDGSLRVDSLPGLGTVVHATIPLVEPIEPKECEEPKRLLGDEEAAALQDRRLHGLRWRASILGGIAAVLLLIWALTGAPNAWPAWPLLGLGLIVGLDAWRVLGTPPARQSDVNGDLRAFRRRRTLRAIAGKLAILNVFLLGIWIAAGAGYFWPAWVLLGSAIAIGLKAAPWPHRWTERTESGA